MSGTIKEMSAEHLETFYGELTKQRKDEIEGAKKEYEKSKKQNIEILEKHFHDRTLQPLSEFNKAGEKETGCSLGFQAEHWYGESDKATFMVKSVLNHTLTEEEKQSKLKQFKKSFYRASEKTLKLFKGLSGLRSQSIIDKQWQQVESGVCYDNLNVADFIREYIAGDLYKLFLYDKAPVIELVTNNNLPEKRFTDGSDKFKGCIEQEKNQDQLYLRSKFLDKFTTLMDLKEKGKNYQDAKGFEKILAAQMLLGEVDIAQPENFGVIEKEYKNAKGEKVKEKLWAKIDHGRSLCFCVDHWSQILLLDFKTLYGIEVDYKELALELRTHVKAISENEELIDKLIDKKASNLNQLLNPEMKFTLGYISSNLPPVSCEEVFRYSSESKEFVSDKGNSLGSYFKQRLKSQIQTMRECSAVLHVTSAIGNDFADIINLSKEFFTSQCKNPLIWAIDSSKEIEGKKQENGQQSIIY